MTNYLVHFTDSATDAEISQYLTEHKCTIVTELLHLNKIVHVSCTTSPETTSIVTSVINDDEVVITPLGVVIPIIDTSHPVDTISTSDEHHWWKIYSATRLDLSQPTVDIDLHTTDTSVVTYLVDSGITLSHPEFAGKRIELLHSITPGDYTDTTGHGTALASVITGATCGINDGIVRIVKIFDKSVQLKTSDLLSAFNAIAADVALSPNNMAIVNLSWAIARNTLIEKQIQSLIDKMVLVVVAAGNSGLPIEDVTPAAMKDVVTVGAYNKDFLPCNFSNYGGTSAISLTTGETNYGKLDIWAPGEQIWVATKGGGYAYVNGTSIAAAIRTATIMYNLPLAMDTGATDITYCRASPQLLQNYGKLWGAKKGLLSLSDVKYVSSPNIIAGYANGVARPTLITTSTSTTVVAVGTSQYVTLAAVSVTKSVELLNDLPNWVFISGNRLYALPVATPTMYVDNGIAYDSLVIDTIVTPRDTSIAPFTRQLVINVVPANTDMTSLPQDGPLSIVFMSDCAAPIFYGGIWHCDLQCTDSAGTCIGGGASKLCTCI